MKIDLRGKTAIVTGSIQGIGKATAKVLASCGSMVIINGYRNQEELNKVADEIRTEGGKVNPVIADVSNKKEAKKLIVAAEKYGGIDILVNNAGGIVKRVAVADFDEEHYNKVMNINLKSAFIMSNLVIPAMKKQKSGKIINLSSQAAHDGGGNGAAVYASSKGAIWTFTKSLAKEVAPFGICVNCVSPGFIASTNFHNTFTPKEIHKQMPSKIPMGRNGKSEDVANIILFLASDLSDYVTGQSLEVNGGLYMP